MELSGAPYDGVLNANPYRFTRELMEPLQMLYDSLVDTGDEAIANGHLLDLIRQASWAALSPAAPLNISNPPSLLRRQSPLIETMLLLIIAHRICCRGGALPLPQVSCFGLSLVKLDIRQESERHSDVMDAITTFLGIGSYKARTRSTAHSKQRRRRRPASAFPVAGLFVPSALAPPRLRHTPRASKTIHRAAPHAPSFPPPTSHPP